MSNTMQRADVLVEMETRETADGRSRYYSIQFYKKNGELVTLTRARSCGLRMNMTDNRTRGVQQVDDHGNAVGHIYPVCIDNIRMFNNMRVKI
jgi:hypothetical protein